MLKIKSSIEKIPGGMMIIPLITGVLLNTFWPELLLIGGLTTAMAKGSAVLIGAFLVCMGAGISFKSASSSLKKGFSITLSKFLVGTLIGILASYFFGEEGIFGLSALAIIAGMTNTNGGLFAALTGEFGDESDIGAIAIISLNDGPFLTMVALGSAGLASFPLPAFIGVVLPLLVGVLLGNLDPEMKHFLLQGGMVLIPFFAFSLGAGMNLSTVLDAGFPGIILGLMATFVGGFFNILTDRLVGGSGISGAAASSTAGNAVATPAAVALADPTLDPMVGPATSQVAAAVITTIICTPILTSYIAKLKYKTKNETSKVE